jgi:hypothetical protein
MAIVRASAFKQEKRRPVKRVVLAMTLLFGALGVSVATAPSASAAVCSYSQDCVSPVNVGGTFNMCANGSSIVSGTTYFYQPGISGPVADAYLNYRGSPCYAAWSESYLGSAANYWVYAYVRRNNPVAGDSGTAQWWSGPYNGGKMLKDCCGGFIVQGYAQTSWNSPSEIKYLGQY